MTDDDRPTPPRPDPAEADPPPPGATAATGPAAAPSRTARMRQTAQHYAVQLEDTALGRLWSRLLEMEFVDRSVALAAKAFVSFFPLLIVFSSLMPDAARQEIIAAIGARLGLTGAVFDVVRQAFTTPDATKAATGVLGVIVTIAFAVSFTTALQRVYLRAWRRPPGGGVINKGRGAVWLGGVFGMLSFLALARTLTGSIGNWVLGVFFSMGLWWWTAHIMLRGEVRWRPLLPTAVVTGLGVWLYTLAAAIWMPANVANNFYQFGTFGIALSFVSWFTGMAFILVVAAAVGPVIIEANDPVSRWIRRGRTDVLVPGAPPPLPGPVRPVRLSDAFGRGSRGSGVQESNGAPDDM